MNYYAVTDNTLYLSHYGILGQKWGVRRFQNKDGTRTKLGKVRYGNQNDSATLVKTVDNNGNTTYTIRKKSNSPTQEQAAERAAQKKAELAYKTELQKQKNEYKKAKQDAKYQSKMQKLNYERELEKHKSQKKLNEAQVKNQRAIANMTLKREEQSKLWGGAKKMVNDALLESGKDILKSAMVAGGKYAVGKMLSSATKNDYFFNTLTNQKNNNNNHNNGGGN